MGTVVFGRKLLKDRDEEEVRGYQKALRLVHKKGSELPCGGKTLLRLHKMCRGDVGDAGEYKRKKVDIIEKACPGVGRDWIQAQFAELKKEGCLSCSGKGLAARWRFWGSGGRTL